MEQNDKQDQSSYFCYSHHSSKTKAKEKKKQMWKKIEIPKNLKIYSNFFFYTILRKNYIISKIYINYNSFSIIKNNKHEKKGRKILVL